MQQMKLYYLILSLTVLSCNAQKKLHTLDLQGPDVTVYMPEKMYDGYTLVAPFTSKNFYLVDKGGFVVKKWEAMGLPGAETAILPDGRILRAEKVDNPAFPTAGSTGGRIHIYNWDNTINWEYDISSETELQHHDVKQLPNGNFLFAVWEKMGAPELRSMGKIFEGTGREVQEMWFDKIIEVKQTGSKTGEIVWEWRLLNHLIQDIDGARPNFKKIAANPQGVDINYNYTKQGNPNSFSHINGIEYINNLDILVLSARNFDELWFIDHSTSTLQAASGKGGKRNKGGDLLYRWGNPFAYKSGLYENRKLFGQHNPTYLINLPDHGGNLMVYNNLQIDSNSVEFSSISEINIPFNNGDFLQLENKTGLPLDYAWNLKPADFASKNVSGAQRLPNSNTLTCTGAGGVFYEFTTAGDLVWKYQMPLGMSSVFKAVRYPKDYPAFKGKKIFKTGQIIN